MSNHLLENSMGQGQGSGSGGSSRLLIKLNNALEAGMFYEAHQLIKTIYFRYMSAGKYDELEGYLQKYSIFFLDNNQIESGADLAIHLSSLYSTGDVPVTLPRINEAIRILEKIPATPERQKYVHSILEWGAKSQLIGSFHSAIAMKFISEKNYHESWPHIPRVNDSDQAVKLILHVIQENKLRTKEIDLVIGIYIMTLLSARKVDLADKAYKDLMKIQLTELTPLLNGTRLIIESAKMKDKQIFSTIRDLYAPSFDRDQYLRKLVTKVGKSLFNIQDKKDSNSNSFVPMLLNAFLSPDQNQ